ncbi:MAG: Ino80 complex subunit Ies6 [Amphiamblys sp. WSBS2006]|nr:MAG: Ino80 complex subunit Ies6 [Amphiamblys sp. WSBS2006]
MKQKRGEVKQEKGSQRTERRSLTKKWVSLQGLLRAEEKHTQEAPLLVKIAAAPSCFPQRKYCDITGLPTTYTDPKTGLNFYSEEIYRLISKMSPNTVQAYLAIKNANVVLK